MGPEGGEGMDVVAFLPGRTPVKKPAQAKKRREPLAVASWAAFLLVLAVSIFMALGSIKENELAIQAKAVLHVATPLGKRQR